MDTVDIPTAARTLERLLRAHGWRAEVVVRDGRWNDSTVSQCVVRGRAGQERVVCQWTLSHASVSPSWKVVSAYVAGPPREGKLYPTRVPSAWLKRWVKTRPEARARWHRITQSNGTPVRVR